MTNPFADLPQVQAINAPTHEAFHRDIVAAEQPVIIRGLLDIWPALKAGRTSIAAMSTSVSESPRKV